MLITYNKFPLDAATRCQGVEDWSLSENVYQMIVNTFGTPDVDLMAKSRPKKKGRKSEAPKKSAQQEDSSDESAIVVSEDLGFLFTFVAAEKKYEKKWRQKSKSLAVVKSSSLPIPHFLQI